MYEYTTDGSVGLTTYNQKGGTNIVNQHVESDISAVANLGGCLFALVIVAGIPGFFILAIFTSFLDFLK